MQLNTTIILTCLFYSVYSFQLPTGSNESQTHQNNIVAEDISRREFFKYTAASIGVVAGILNPLSANADIVRSPGKCANGEGEGCDSLAGGNEFIRSLQKKSSENREANQREALNAYYMKNYPDVFNVYDKKMVKKSDGSFALFTAAEVEDLRLAGKLKLEYPTSKGGRIADLTQKPILVMVD
mmetsp:Transcript_1913/g.4163  ORF Transcript_1913/g.4163 Transcript_1913/m.4163 type:complete len:183 (+) Transcript_1913:123-671(+)|eukprot:CAMPEP_0171352008 /NCGR_PEP_ID=MMETSP0878-20121228/40392_1 /TAXON_ID=67004 /ORGANISM="Thalassiosira weissflogii, Strain CCMP1336" /LENGTH=182 /DNA_ID=CAMNT_0011857463 /DNA_START=99 /DNA_END=647 /DNA_ORIENTATION=-